ncbi:MAG TPA: MlaD family protein [Verrucomicrobiae bacterium]|nr:MlaD family protein [Verrucomicrobiae bacterium]
MAERFKFKRVKEITGTFVLAVVAVLVAAVVWTGRSQRWFKTNVNLRIVLPADGAAGIRQGSEIYFLGTLVGSVSDVLVDATGRMEAQTRIRRDFFRFVRVDSSAVVKKKFGVAGDSLFEITRGTGKSLPEGDASIVCNEQYQSALELAVEEIRQESLLVLQKTSAGLDVWAKLGVDLGITRQRLDNLAASLENMAAGVAAGKGTMGKLVAETALADELQNLLANGNGVLGAAQTVLTSLNVVARNVGNATERLPDITHAVADEMRDLPGLVRQTQTSMRELERLIEAMQRHWVLRKYVNPTNPPPVNLPLAIPMPKKVPSKSSR